MRVPVAVMGVTKSGKSHDVDEEAKDADDEKLVKAMQLMTFPQPLEGIEDDLHTHKPRRC